MTCLPPRFRPRTVVRRRDRSGASGEEGFILLESMVAISLITVILAALGTFTVRTVQTTNDLRARQAATQVATSAMASLGALPSTDLVTGRDPASVTTQFDAAPASVAPSLANMTRVSDASARAGAGATAAVPTTGVPQTLNDVVFTVNTYLGSCLNPVDSRACAAVGSGVTYLRAVVAVTWSGRGCTAGACAYVTSTLINADGDPVFNTNRAVPPVTPVVKDPGNQVSTVGGLEELQLAVKDGTGVPPLSWSVVAGTLPTGLSLSASGLVSGTPTAVRAAAALTVTVTDAFGRTGSVPFTWAVVAPPTIATPPAQTSVRGTALSLATTSTCPNSPCVFTLANAPAGLSVNASTGTISGTPTTVGLSPSVTVTVTDASGVAVSTSPFSWSVTSIPTVTPPGAAGYTVGTTVRIPIPYTCPTPTCTITLNSGIPGLTLTTTDTTRSSSTQFATPGSVDTSGTVNLSAGKTATQSSLAYGGVASRAVDGNTDGVYNNSSTTHTDIEAQPWWQVDLGTASLVRAVRIANRTDCCDTRLSNFYVFTSPTDMQGRTAAQLLADPTVAVQRISGLGGQPSITIPAQSHGRFVRVQLSGSEYLSLAEVQVLGTADTATSITVGATSGTVYATGVVPAAAVPSGTSRVYNPSLTITDLTGTSSTSAAGPWTAYTAPTLASLETRAMRTRTSPDVPVAYTCPNRPCTVSLAGSVPGLGLSATAGVTGSNGTTSLTLNAQSGTVYVNGYVETGAVPSGASKVYSPVLTITDSGSPSASATSAGTWTVSKGTVLASPGPQVAEPGQNLSLAMQASCAGSCTGWTAAAQPAGDPNFYPVPISSSGVISYNNAPAGSYTLRVTVTDSTGGTDTVTFPLTVQTFSLTIPNQQTNRPLTGTTTVTLDVANLVSPTPGAYTFSISGAPAWLSLDRTTGLLTASVTALSFTDLAITVTAASSASASSTVASTFSWTIR